MPDTIPVGKYYNFDNKNVDVVYNPDENKSDSGGGVFVVNVHVEPDGDGKTGGMRMVCDKTADEMFQASKTKSVVLKIVLADNDVGVYMHIISAAFGGEGNGYQFLVYSLDGSSANRVVFSAMNADGYPSYSA